MFLPEERDGSLPASWLARSCCCYPPLRKLASLGQASGSVLRPSIGLHVQCPMDHGGLTYTWLYLCRAGGLLSRCSETPIAYANFYWCLHPIATAEQASPTIAADDTLDTLTLRNGEGARMENGEPDFRVHADGARGIVFYRSLAQLLTLSPCVVMKPFLPHRF